MDKNTFFDIVLYAKQRCREIIPSNPYMITERNASIVNEISKTYGIETVIAKEIFDNINDVEALDTIYKKYHSVSIKNGELRMNSYVTEEVIYRVLNAFRNNPNAKASDLGLDRSLYNSVMEIIQDERLAKGINVKHGGNGDVYLVLVRDVRLTLAGIKFLDSRTHEPSVYPKEENDYNTKPSIFLSYSWNDFELADKIEDVLQKNGFIVHRDVRDIGPWKSIKEFMKTIRNKDYVVSLISENYLFSENCMYEVGELLKDDNYKEKLFPAVTCSDIYKVEKQIEYVQFWEKRNKILESQLERLSFSNRASFTEAYRKSKEIESKIGDFLKTVTDMNNPKLEDVGTAIVKEIQERENKKKNLA